MTVHEFLKGATQEEKDTLVEYAKMLGKSTSKLTATDMYNYLTWIEQGMPSDFDVKKKRRKKSFFDRKAATEDELIAGFAEFKGVNPKDIEMSKVPTYSDVEVEVDGEEWSLFESYDSAEEVAREVLRDNIESDLEAYSDTLINNYLDEDRIRADLSYDAGNAIAEEIMEGVYDDVLEEYFSDGDGVDEYMEWVEEKIAEDTIWGELDDDIDFENPESIRDKYTEEDFEDFGFDEDDIEKAIETVKDYESIYPVETFIEERGREIVADGEGPYDKFVESYIESMLSEINSFFTNEQLLNYVDIDSFVDDVVRYDGIGFVLNSYDGEYEEFDYGDGQIGIAIRLD